MSGTPWSEVEERMLRFMYLAGTSFDEIGQEFPERSSNAIRLKASRLGLKRPPGSSYVLASPNVLRFSDGNGDTGFFFKCVNCGSWMHAQIGDDTENQTVECSECSTVCRYIA
ncbi:MAG: hypothetical protein QGF78_06605 [Candidatus Bathyarchaeota archaeon]|jgi:hypothetical protein|nr:hypothetical protein [Candidatus Bathyarchaeota archaeon]|tara:strand:+ start:251 stop:589 length:339 start_codon:yes stop_codon:yes gene_type:complete